MLGSCVCTIRKSMGKVIILTLNKKSQADGEFQTDTYEKKNKNILLGIQFLAVSSSAPSKDILKRQPYIHIS